MSKTYTFNLAPYGIQTSWDQYITNFNFNQPSGNDGIGYDWNYDGTQYQQYGINLSEDISVVGTISSISLQIFFSSVEFTKGIRIAKKTGSGNNNYGYTNINVDVVVEQNATSVTANLTNAGLCEYGYLLYQADFNTYAKNRCYVSSAVLTIVTDATDYSYTLSYDANGGSGAPSGQSGNNTVVDPSYTFVISQTAPTRDGYDFLGWSTSNSATTASYQPGDSITVNSSGTTTLYAVWKIANILRIVNSAGTGLDMYIIYVVENNNLVPYRMTIVNSTGTSLDPYA